MGVKRDAIQMSNRINSGELRNIDNPYTHLAASIIIQAYDDLKALGGSDRKIVDAQNVTKYEIINFFRSPWCGRLLSCQEAVSQEMAIRAAYDLAGL